MRKAACSSPSSQALLSDNAVNNPERYRQLNPEAMPSERRFNRDEVSAIIRRAAEVTHWEQVVDDQLGADDLLAVADEAGLSRSAVLTALAERRAGMGEKDGEKDTVLGRVVGPRHVWSTSQVAGTEADIAEAVRRWLEIDRGMQTNVQPDGVVVAEPKSGLVGAVSSSIRKLEGKPGLEGARRVTAAAASSNGVATLCVAADVGNKRMEAVAGGTAVAGGVTVIVATAAVLTTPFTLLVVPVGMAGGAAVARLLHRRNLAAMARRIEMATESVARGEQPRHPVNRMLRSGLSRRLGQ